MVTLGDRAGADDGVRPFGARLVGGSRPAIIEFTGDFDLAAEQVAREAIAAAWVMGTRSLVLDLSSVGFMDCTGVMCLLAAQETADASGRELSLRLSGPARRVLELCGVLSRFALAP